MVENADIIHLTDLLSDKIICTDEYKAYMKALAYIRNDQDLMYKVKRLKRMHMVFAEHRASNNASFEEEKYVSQEFYKLMLDKNVEDYFIIEHKMVKLLCGIYCRLAEKCVLDIFVGD